MRHAHVESSKKKKRGDLCFEQQQTGKVIAISQSKQNCGQFICAFEGVKVNLTSRKLSCFRRFWDTTVALSIRSQGKPVY